MTSWADPKEEREMQVKQRNQVRGGWEELPPSVTKDVGYIWVENEVAVGAYVSRRIERLRILIGLRVVQDSPRREAKPVVTN